MDYKARLELEGYKIRVRSNSEEYIKGMKKEFSPKARGYFWSPKYKSGAWDGRIHFITDANLMPYGLLPDYLKAHKKFPGVRLEVEDQIKTLFKGEEFEIKYDLSLPPRPYQKETVEYTLKYSKGIIRSATASGKSLVISYIIKNLLDNRHLTKVRRALVIVPSTSLVEQFRNDMGDYGIDKEFIGRVYTKYKEWDKSIVISTWQSLQNYHKMLALYDCVIADECHTVKAHELKKIMSRSKARYRLGFTGTLPNNESDLFNIKAYLGPVLREYPSGLLAEQGYIAPCNVKVLSINYPIGLQSEYYRDVKDEVFNNEDRLKLIADFVNSVDDNVLLLVNYIAEGVKLTNLINRHTDKEVVFLKGADKVEMREEWRQKMIKEKNIALIATYGIFQQGINIPPLKYLVLASPTKSKIRTLQSVGRTLRAHENKKDGATILDIIDEVKYLKRHGDRRIEFYKSEGFKIDIIDLQETSSANAIAACLA